MTPTAKSLANLTPMKPGHTANPNGRPKGATLKAQVQSLFIAMMEEPIKAGNRPDVPFLQAYKKAFIKSALAGTWASKILADKLFADDILDQLDRSLNKDIRENEDFQLFRILNKAHDVQQKILLSKYRKIYQMAGRRSGKTRCNILSAIKTAQKPDAQILIICLTQETAMKLYWDELLSTLEDLGHDPKLMNKNEGHVQLENDSSIYIKGNNSTTDREKFRGSHWDLVVIDEAQSQSALPYLITSIIDPTLLDTQGQLIVSGTGPRVKGTYWENIWSNDATALKINYNLTDNPFIKNHKQLLEQIKEEKGLTDSSPLFQREYLGLCVYDEDAQVWRLKEDNYYTPESFKLWLNSQPLSDIKFTSGLDYGYADCDAFVIICYSTSLPEKFVLYEYKANRTGVTELYHAIKKGIDQVQSDPLFITSRPLISQTRFPSDLPVEVDKQFYIFCDTNEQKISHEFRTQYNLPTINAYKYDKNLAIELLAEEIRTGCFKILKGSQFEDETFKTIWKRNDKDELTREIDDDNFHPDLSDAIIYSLRMVWKYQERTMLI